MPRTEARIFTSIWNDPHFLSLDASSQRLYFFLLSQDDLTYSGIMPLRPRRWRPTAAGLTVADIEVGLKALEASPRRFIIVDEDMEELFIRSLLRRDGIWKQPNLLKLAWESAGQSRSHLLRSELVAELRRLPLEESPSVQVKTLVASFIQDLEQGTPHPTPHPPGDPADHPSDHPADEGTADLADDPTAKDYAYARGNGVATSSTEVIPVPLFPDAPTSLPPQDRKTGRRLPEGFTLTPDMRAWASKNTPHVNQDREFDRFRDHWLAKPGKDGRKLDWLMTWRNWMRTAEDRQGPRDRYRDNRADMRGGARQQLATAEEVSKLRPEDIV